ncbi:YdjY domain-containing protein [Luteolibacter marinus]|uniref:YdjY domain-containing protein n=1 Tax=Luteolibacter marinus TaxID=2776705 RepID=UPI0018681360|nr:YdjY domain-containing protein [Luteolibacter marinus]
MFRPVVLFLAGTRLLCADPSTDRAPVEPRTLPAPDQPVTEAKPAIKELDADRLQIGEVIFNRKTREIRFPAAVNMAGDELLEFAIVHSKGKIHESLLLTEVSPTHLNLAFKLLRYQASPEFYPLLDEDGTVTSKFPEVMADVKAAARVDLSVEWKQDGKDRKAKLREWIAHGSTGESMAADPWVYGGSEIYEGKFMAETSGDVAAIFLSNTALINFSGKDNNSDEVWLPYPKRVPPVGTKVTVIIAPFPTPAAKP